MGGLLGILARLGVAVRLSLSTLPQRRGAAAAAAAGIAGVVAIMVGVLSIGEGFKRTLESSASPENAVAMRSGSDTELMSILELEETRIIAEAPGIAHGASGPVVSAELFALINLPKRSTGTDANVPLRGVQPAASLLRSRFRIVAGRTFQPGLNEVIVGAGAVREFAGLSLGEVIPVGGDRWPVVGVFEAGGGVAESEIWADAAVVQQAYRRGTTFQSVYAKLESRAAYDVFRAALSSDPRVSLKLLREEEYQAEQARLLHGLIRNLGTIVAVLMGLGAVFGALNTMYTAVAARTREIATLRALGFGAFPVVGSVILEALVLALSGGTVGAAIAYFVFDGFRTATMNFASFSQVAFAFAVTPSLLAQGILYSVLIGTVGGLLPAIRAARMPVATALREQ